jgi:N-acyl-L-homoserine lactone synthetase
MKEIVAANSHPLRGLNFKKRTEWTTSCELTVNAREEVDSFEKHDPTSWLRQVVQWSICQSP